VNLILALQPLSMRDGYEKVMARCVEDERGCWVWQGGKQGKGYGVVNYDGRAWLTHRLVYEAEKGPIPDGLQIDHLCRNRVCCNPNHLEAVTPRVNVLRGNVGKRERERTHCPKGHEYTPENTKVKKRGSRGSRSCKACEAEWQRRFRVRKPWKPKSVAMRPDYIR
jgi:hypothetical protein